MSAREETVNSEIIDRVVEMTTSDLGPDQGPIAAAFVRRLYANAAVEDLAAQSPETLRAAALGLWQFGATRKPGTARIRVFNPVTADDGWTARHSVVEIVNDDMPFLVDSVVAELNRRDLTVHRLLHPIVPVQRDGQGAALAIADAGGAESFMQIEIDEQGPPERRGEIERGIAQVLHDVRAAVVDWAPMRVLLKSVIAGLDREPPPVPMAEIDDVRAFLSWLVEDRFTFLGVREYAYGAPDGEARWALVPGKGLGLCQDDSFIVFDALRDMKTLPADIQAFLREPRLLRIAKANRRSTVHRPVYYDTIGIKTFDRDGKVVGERLFVGLFTASAYRERPRDIPMLADKVKRLMARAGFAPSGHDGKALVNILETYPRDELFQASEDELLTTCLGILRLQVRQRIALFVRRDPFERFVSALLFVPRDRFNSELRARCHAMLAEAYGGRVSAFYTQYADETALVRVHLIVGTMPGEVQAVDVVTLEQRMIETGRSYADRLRDALIAAHGEEIGLERARVYREAFSAGYRERFAPETVVADIDRIEAVRHAPSPFAVELHRPAGRPDEELNLRIIHREQPMALSDIMPMLENLGLRVLAEEPWRIDPAGAPGAVWIQDFTMAARPARAFDLAAIKVLFEDAFAKIWRGAVENDSFNRLVLGAGLSAREVNVLRAYAKYLRQTGIAFSQAYMESTLVAHPAIARTLIELFTVLHDPARTAGAEARAVALGTEIERLLDAVSVLDEDRILRRFLNLVRATLRTNMYQHDADGRRKAYLSFKLDSHTVDELPLPRPLVEIWVYSPRVEGIHLRGGRVARGGIRWSDRREDFRTEILGLMKAQMVKNAVIVPVGSKGGFFVKQPPAAEAGREAALAEGIACYQTLMRGMLDLTDNITPGGIVAPAETVRRDGDDPYLVVAADKGTATFSDIANGVSREYGFWLDDAFASGGSAGYDHKAMGITARGAWEAVKRHFRELGLDTQATDFTVMGVGDMSGDVFGNGMLRSAHIKLVGAFDHRHIFIDPSPDPAASFAERQRLFKLPRSSWMDYDAALISRGGGVFDRKAKTVRLSAEIKALFDIAADQATPAELMKAMLAARVDLLWLGGIGTYVKASAESHADVGDRANDAIRIDGRQVRARVVGEGANLGFTQRGRVECARDGGGGLGVRLNTDAIDNSAGVDTSDHEVNIKILLGDVVARGGMTLQQRDVLLASMTDELGLQVLRDNYLQTQALSLAECAGAAALDDHVRLMRGLERAGRLNRAVEFLPDDEELRRRIAMGKGLTRPELAVLLAYAKIALYDALLPSDLPDDPHLAVDLQHYFPAPLAEGQHEAIGRHRLRREIIATVVTNDAVNRTGICFMSDSAERSQVTPAEATRAYMVVREAFELGRLWRAIEALDNTVPAATQYRMLADIQALIERVTPWLLANLARPIAIAGSIARFAPGIATLRANAAGLMDAARLEALRNRAAAYAKDGVPADLADEVAHLDVLAAAPLLASIAAAAGPRATIEDVARRYFAIGARLGLDWLRDAARAVKAETVWQRRAIEAVIDDFNAQQADFAARASDNWVEQRTDALRRSDDLLAELRMTPSIDLAALTIAARQLRAVTGV